MGFKKKKKKNFKRGGSQHLIAIIYTEAKNDRSLKEHKGKSWNTRTHTLDLLDLSSHQPKQFTNHTDLPDVITVDTGDQHLALVVVDEESSDHGGGLTQCLQAILENWIEAEPSCQSLER